MERVPKAVYTPEFRAEAVALVFRDGLKASEAARQLAISKKTLDNWLASAKAGKLAAIGLNRAPVTAQEAEISRLRKELAETKMERDRLKKAAAYFARDSLPVYRASSANNTRNNWGYELRKPGPVRSRGKTVKIYSTSRLPSSTLTSSPIARLSCLGVSATIMRVSVQPPRIDSISG